MKGASFGLSPSKYLVSAPGEAITLACQKQGVLFRGAPPTSRYALVEAERRCARLLHGQSYLPSKVHRVLAEYKMYFQLCNDVIQHFSLTSWLQYGHKGLPVRMRQLAGMKKV